MSMQPSTVSVLPRRAPFGLIGLLCASALACGGTADVAPAITAEPADVAVALGSSAVFNVVATGTAPTYQWQRNGADLTGANADTYTIAAASAADDKATFAVVVKNAAGSVTSSAAMLRVGHAEIATQPQDLSVGVGASAAFSVVATGTGTLTYQWKKGGAAIAGATGPAYSIATALSLDAGSYSCAVTSTLGAVVTTVTTRAAALLVVPPPVITAHPAAATVAAGAPLSLSVTASGSGALSYQWLKDDANLSGATASTYTRASSAGSDSGKYKVQVTNTVGGFGVTVASHEAAVAVVVGPTVTTSGSLTIAEGAPAALSITATAAAGMPASTYQWRKGGVAITNATSTALSFGAAALSDAGSYVCDATAAVGNVSVTTSGAAQILSVVALPTFTAQPQGGTYNEGGNVTFTVVANAPDAVTYQWRKGGVAIPGATAATFNIAAAGASDAGDYTCLVSNTRSGVSASKLSDAATLVVHAAPQITAQPQDVTADETSVVKFTVAAAGSGLTYQWYRSGAPIAGATASTYSTPPITTDDNGAQYWCLVSNGFPPDKSSVHATLTVTLKATDFRSSVSSLVTGEGVILTYSFAGTGELAVASGTSTATSTVANGGSTIDYPLADTTYTLNVTSHGATKASVLQVAVKSYVPKHLYVANVYPAQDPPAPADSIAHFVINPVLPFFPGDPTVYLPDHADAGATPTSTIATGGSVPVHIAVSPDERNLYVSNYGSSTVDGSSSISAFSIDSATGELTAVAGSPYALVGARQPSASVLDASGTHLYVACADGLKVFSRNTTTGALTAAPALDVAIAGRVQGDLLVHPSGRFLYVVDSGHGVVKAYALNASTGTLNLLADAPSPGGPIGAAFDRAGARLFTRGVDTTPLPTPNPAYPDATYNGAVHTFAVDPYTGLLSETSAYKGFGANAMIVQDLGPDGQMPFVPGDQGRHGLAYGKVPGQETLYSGYSNDWSLGVNNGGFSMSAFTVGPTGPIADRIDGNGNGGLGSPYISSVFYYQSAGDSVVLDRGGNTLVLTGPSPLNTCTVYEVNSQTGDLMGLIGFGFNSESSLHPGEPMMLVGQTHAAFTGAQQ